MLPVRGHRVRSFLLGIGMFALLIAGVGGGWIAMNGYEPGSIGTPAHAGAISNGRPDQCTNVNFSVKQRAEAKRTIPLDENTIVRGTWEVDGGFGRVDILMRIVDPQGRDTFASPKVENYDFMFPVKLRGDYTFVFDNRYSMYTAKSVGLYYCVDAGAPRSPGSAPLGQIVRGSEVRL